MRASTRRILSILISGALFIGTVVIYANLVQPAAIAIGDQRQVVFSKKSTFDDQRAAVERVQELVAEFQGAAQLQDTMELVLPRAPETTELLHQLEAIARSSQVFLSSFTLSFLPFEPGRNPLVQRLGVLEASISVEGSYSGVRSFFRAVEQNVRLLSVQELTIGAAGDGSLGEDLFSADATVRAYYQP